MDAIAATLESDEQRMGSEIIKKALFYPLRLIATNAGVNGSVVMNKVRAVVAASAACLKLRFDWARWAGGPATPPPSPAFLLSRALPTGRCWRMRTSPTTGTTPRPGSSGT